MAATNLSLEMLGGFRGRVDSEKPVELPYQPSAALLAFLALHKDRAFHREELIDLFWPEEPLEIGRHRLRQSLYAIRNLLEKWELAPDALLLTTRNTVQINPTLVQTDVAAFNTALENAEKTRQASERIPLLTEAARLYTGRLLPGFFLDPLVAEQHRLEERYESALHTLARDYEQTGDLERAIEMSQRLVANNPLAEEAHCDLMRFYAAKGQTSLVLRQFQELEQILERELGEKPSESARELMESLRRRSQARPAPSVSPVAAPAPPASPPASSAVEPAVKAGKKQDRRSFLVGAAALMAILLIGLAMPRPRQAKQNGSDPPSPPIRELRIERFEPGPEDRDSKPVALATDKHGNLYMAGFIQTAKREDDFLVVKYGPNGEEEWPQRYNGEGNDWDIPTALCLDGDGSVFVAGKSDGGTGNGKTKHSELDYAVVKLDSEGTELWHESYNGPGDGEDIPCKVKTDYAGNVYVTGTSWERNDPKLGPRFAIATVCYSADGDRLWDARYFPDRDATYRAFDLHVYDAGSYCVVGMQEKRGANGAPEREVVVLFYDSGGKTIRWVKTLTNRQRALEEGVCLGVVDWGHSLPDRGNLIVAVAAPPDGDSNVPTGVLTMRISQHGKGEKMWERWIPTTAGGAVKFHLESLAALPDGSFYLAGLNVLPPDNAQYSVIKCDVDGTPLWSRQAHCQPMQGALLKQAVRDNEGGVVVTGIAHNARTDVQMSNDQDYLTIAYDRDGNERWRQVFDDRWHGQDQALALALLSDGRVAVTGRAYGGETFDIVTILYGP